MNQITHPCPLCQAVTTWSDNPNRPFCSKRCKLIDLGAWASDEYLIAGDELPSSENHEVADY